MIKHGIKQMMIKHCIKQMMIKHENLKMITFNFEVHTRTAILVYSYNSVQKSFGKSIN